MKHPAFTDCAYPCCIFDTKKQIINLNMPVPKKKKTLGGIVELLLHNITTEMFI